MEQKQGGLTQPALGIWGSIFVILLSYSVFIWFKPEGFGSYLTWFAIAMIPMEVIIGMVWQGNYPPPAATLAQPLKGVYLFLVMAMVGLIVGSWTLKYVGGMVTPPTPFLNMYMILSVPVALWMVVCFQCWPAAAIKKHPAFIGLGTLFLSYIVCLIIFRLSFNFGFAEKAPWYVAALDPKGAFMAFDAIAFYVTAVGVILACVLLDFWPLSKIPPKAPWFGKQPVFGIVATIWVLIWSWIVWAIFKNAMGMDVVSYMLKVAVCWIFGEFIMLVMMETWPFQKTKQPGRGFGLIICTIILAIVMYYIYRWLGVLATGGLPAGPPAFAQELWIASAMLGVTFPMMVLFTGFFGSWPLREPAPPPPPAK